MVIGEVDQARADAWKLAFNTVALADVLKCTVELEIPDALENHGGPMSLSELSAAVGCSSLPALHRIMKFLVHQGIFKTTTLAGNDHESSSIVRFGQTALSRHLTKNELGPYFMLSSVAPHGPYNGLCAEALRRADTSEDKIWKNTQTSKNLELLSAAMECLAKATTSAIIKEHAECFKGIGSLVDVGGHRGLALTMLVRAFPWIRGINFDLPETVSKTPPSHDGMVVHVAGNMFHSNIPKGDAIMLMRVLHNWSDETCIHLLKKCKEALTAPNHGGKVMIVDCVMDEEGEYEACLGADMVMMRFTVKGKERNAKEWDYLLKQAGFPTHTIKPIPGVIESLIQAFP